MNKLELTPNKDDIREHDHMNSRLRDSLFSKDLAPHYMKLAGQLAASEMVPKCFRNKPSDLFLCWAMGYQIGIAPEQAMNCIAVVNGKAVMWGDEMLALCMNHPDFLDIIESPITGAGDTVIGYACTIKRKNRTPHVSIFNLEMAKKAGLLAKGGVWTHYPERMLKLRARGFALRDAFPDALKGIKSCAEVEDYIEAEFIVQDKSAPRTRTDRLKQELMDDFSKGCDSSVENQEIEQSHNSASEAYQKDQAEASEAELHTKIKKYIDENAIPQERIDKALKYYEVERIEDMERQAALHLINQMMKI